MAGVELASAYITLVPSFKGGQEAITDALPDPAGPGDEQGKGYGEAFLAAAAGLIAADGIKQIGQALYGIGAEFDDMSDSIRIGTGATGQALGDMEDIAKRVATTVPTSFSEAGQTVADLNTRMGLTGDTLQTVASQTVEAGNMMGSALDINAMSSAMNAFQVSGDDVSGALDRVFQVSQATGVGMNDLFSKVTSAAPAMSQLGFSFDDTVAMMGSFDKAGLNGQATVAAMQKGLVTLAKSGEDPQEAFRRVTGEIGEFIKSGDQASALDLAGQVFGTRGAAQFTAALQSGALNVDDLANSVQTTGDTILDTADETNDFAENWTIFKNKATEAIEPVATALFNGLGGALDKVGPPLLKMINWVTGNKAAMAAVATVIGGVLVVALIAATAAIWGMVAGIWASTVALLANPVTWIVIGIMALIAALVLLIANWDSVVAWLKSVWQACVDWLKGVWQAVSDAWTAAWEAIKTWWSGLIDGVVQWATDKWNGFTSWLGGIWDAVKNGWTNGWNAIKNWYIGLAVGFVQWIQDKWNGIKSTLTGIWDAVKTTWSNAWNALKNTVSDKVNGVVEFVQGLPNTIKNVFSNAVSWLRDAGGNILQGLINGLRNSKDAVVNFLKGIAGDAIDGFKAIFGIHSPSRVMRQMGVYVGQGLVLGLEDMAPTIDAAAANLLPQQDYSLGVNYDGNGGQNYAPRMHPDDLRALGDIVTDGAHGVALGVRAIDDRATAAVRTTNGRTR